MSIKSLAGSVLVVSVESSRVERTTHTTTMSTTASMNPSTALPPAAPTSATHLAMHSEQATSQPTVGSLAAVVPGGVPAAALPSSMHVRHWPAPSLLGNSLNSGSDGERSPTALWCQEKEQRRLAPKRPAPPGAALTPRAKKKKNAKKALEMKPYYDFCRAHRPMLATSLRNAERERILGERWRALSEAERAAKWGSPAPHTAPISASTSAVLGHYPAPGPPAPSREPCPVQRPVHRVTPPDRHVASSAQQTAAADAPLAFGGPLGGAVEGQRSQGSCAHHLRPRVVTVDRGCFA